jgi:two-component system sensor histidine kinase HydH
LSEEDPKVIRLRSAPLLGATGQELGVEFLFTDETELRKLRFRIKHSEKLATIGELAAGIAHEIRNPLGAMKGFAEILQRKLADRPDEREMVSDIASEIEILNKIVTNFLTFAKPASLELQETDLAEAVRGVLPLVEKEAGQKGVRIEFKGEGDLVLRLDTEQFRRALLNLILNAVQASPRGGRVEVGLRVFGRSELTEMLEGLGARAGVPLEAAGRWVGVWVTDEGGGIAPENLGRLFTPFFTTKMEGFGLGLSITRKIFEALGGGVQAANRKEGGAIFLGLLPLDGPERKKGVRDEFDPFGGR